MKPVKLFEQFLLESEESYSDYPKAASANAKKALDWRDEYGRDEVDAGTPVGWQRANQLAKGEAVSRDVVSRMAQFNRHRKNSKVAPEFKDTPWKDRGYVAWLIWGGDEGVDWAMDKMEQIKKEEMNEKKQTYDYGCVMLYFDMPEMQDLHKQIEKSDIYTEDNDQSYGLETEPHCTLLYGLHEEVTTEMVEDLLKEFTFSNCSVKNASLFENEKFDVLKFDVAGDNLHACNKELCKFPHTTSFPDYHPHMTIAYLKPDMGAKYCKLLKDYQYNLKPKYVVYSHPDGSKTQIELK